jgi:hypothetical protein
LSQVQIFISEDETVSSLPQLLVTQDDERVVLGVREAPSNAVKRPIICIVLIDADFNMLELKNSSRGMRALERFQVHFSLTPDGYELFHPVQYVQLLPPLKKQ